MLKSFGDTESGVYSLPDSSDEVAGVSVAVLGHVVGVVHADGQILGHVSLLNGLDSGGLKGLAEGVELLVVVKLGSVHQSPSPGEDRGNRVSGGLFSLLVLSVVSSDGSVGSFGLDSSIGSVEY